MNKFDILTKQFSQNKIMQRVDEKTTHLFTDKPFRVRAYPIYLLSLVITFACQLASGFTEVYMLWNWASGMNVVFSVAFVALLAFTIETAKRWGANEAILNKTMLGVSLLVVSQVASVYISYKGAKALPKEVIQEPVLYKPILVNIDSLNNVLDAAILAKSNEVKQYFENFKKVNKETGGWRLSSSKAVRLPYNELLQNLQLLERNKIEQVKAAQEMNNVAINKASSDYKEAMLVYNQRLIEDGNIYGYISLGIELLFLLAFCVMYFYLSKSHNEKEAHADDKENTNATLKNAIDTNISPTNENNSVKPSHVSLVAKTDKKIPTFKDFNDKVRNCDNCGKAYKYKRVTSQYCTSRCRAEYNLLKAKTK